MITSAQRALPPNMLMGYCDADEMWYKFTDDPNDISSRNCPDCGGRPSVKTGNQITTQRTFDTSAKKLTKSQLKKMGGIGA